MASRMRVLQVLADAEGVLVRVLVERLEQAGASVWGQALPVQQRRGGLQCRRVLAVEDLVPVEPQRAVVRPLVAVEQQPLVRGRPESRSAAGASAPKIASETMSAQVSL